MSLDWLPSLFIASSTEGLPVAHDLQEALENDCHATVWSQGVFEPSRTVLQGLLSELAVQQFALFVFTPDDSQVLRGESHRVARDNVVFELGLFIGALGLPQCMHIVPRGMTSLHLPSDLLGLTALDYPADRPDGNRLAALGPACNKIRRRLRSLPDANRPASAAMALPSPAVPPDRAMRLQAYWARWSAPPLVDDRAVLRAGVTLDPYDDELPRASLRRIFNFLESLSEAVLSEALDEAAVKQAFGQALVSFWPHGATLLAPPNHVDDFWDPTPSIAQLYLRWR